MADIKKELNDIKNAVYGKEVRGSIHDGIKKINEESEESKQKAEEAHEITQDLLDETFDSAALETNFKQRLNDEIANLQPEWTGFKSEIDTARASFPKLTDRIDSIDNPRKVTLFKQYEGANYFRIPFIDITNNNVIIAGADFRSEGHDDSRMDIGIKRSLDGGKTWEETQIILPNNDIVPNSRKMDGTILVDRESNRVFVFALVFDMAESWKRASNIIWDFVYKYSDDDGANWSEEISLKSIFLSDPTVKFAWGGVGKGITMEDGTLVLPIQVKNTYDTPLSQQSSIIYSRDNGMTWTWAGTRVPADVTECMVVEYETGKLLLNGRGRNGARRIFTSDDLGETWERHVTDDNTLIDPACQGSTDLLKLGEARFGLFLNPKSTRRRENMVLQATQDFINYYPVATLERGETDGYSCLANYNGQIVALIERKGSIEFHDLTHVKNNITSGIEYHPQNNMYTTAFINEEGVLRVNPEQKVVFVDVANSQSDTVHSIEGCKAGQQLFITNFSGSHPFYFEPNADGVKLNSIEPPNGNTFPLHIVRAFKNNYDITNNKIWRGEWLHINVTNQYAEIINTQDFAEPFISILDTTSSRVLTQHNRYVLYDVSNGWLNCTLPPLADVPNYHEITIRKKDNSSNYINVRSSNNELLGDNPDNTFKIYGHNETRKFIKINNKWYVF